MESHMARGLFGVECRAVTPLGSEAEEGLRVMESFSHLEVGYLRHKGLGMQGDGTRYFWTCCV